MDPILSILELITDHIGAVAGVLIILAGMVSARRKARRGQEEREAYDRSEGSTFPEGPKKNVFWEPMDPWGGEWPEPSAAKPWELPSMEEPPLPQKPITSTVAPAAAPKKPSAAPQTVAKPLPPEVQLPGDLTADAAEKGQAAAKKAHRRNELVTAVIMSEVLAKPKGLNSE